MATKTITVTEGAYEALRAQKGPNESFSDTILRVTRRKPLSYFYGTLSRKSADKLEKSIREARKRHAKLHRARIERISREMES